MFSLFQIITNNNKREVAIKDCIAITSSKIKALKEHSEQNELTALKSLKSEQTKVNNLDTAY